MKMSPDLYSQWMSLLIACLLCGILVGINRHHEELPDLFLDGHGLHGVNPPTGSCAHERHEGRTVITRMTVCDEDWPCQRSEWYAQVSDHVSRCRQNAFECEIVCAAGCKCGREKKEENGWNWKVEKSDP